MKYRLTAILILLILLLTGCNQSGTSLKQPDNTKASFVDALGHNVTVHKADRVIALSGSFAETWLLAGGNLIGTTQDAFTDGPALDESVHDVGRLHSPSLEQIIALEPDLVLLSKSISAHVKLYDQLKAAGITTAYFDVEVFGEYLDMLKICTDITGRRDLYESNGIAVKSRIDKVISKANRAASHPRVLFVRVNSTSATARNSDTMAGAMLKDLGCINIADSQSSLLKNLSMETIIQEDPNFIFSVTMGESEEKALKVLEETLEANPAWSGLTAVKNKQNFILPKDLFHLKPNNRWGESYERLYGILYDEK
ncbi:iron complex transport system substrate-binding protein [Ruminiclostridium sufflavum DSM 19573]|uniref:Iron complex transport system substrate-binding protein n=1 Tax=Ruminiclostridium sufflavum DSM 19573 TaxID=1121337 RepID=A0A318Y1E3_9FIRM|nr:ABC transporter substrate-binding protein [Ruminiclostridium sufflavum]PYG84858.1 iron complex transport system substrate-binding protein [Ruminiclostridium sufflavum DSM 19573]